MLSKKIKEHIKDIWNLSIALFPTEEIILSKLVDEDMKEFIDMLRNDPNNYSENNKITLSNEKREDRLELVFVKNP